LAYKFCLPKIPGRDFPKKQADKNASRVEILPCNERNPLRKENLMRTLGKILKGIAILYVAVFALMLGMVLMTNMMLVGLQH